MPQSTRILQGRYRTTTIAITSDTYIREGGGNNTVNFSSSTTLATNRQASSDTRSLLVYFDLSSFPAHTNVLSANLLLTTKDADVAQDLIAYRLLVPYTLAQATWDIRATATSWNTVGALGVGTDHDGTAIFTSAIPLTIDTLMTINMASTVSNWIRGVWANNGLVAWCVDSGTTVLREFHSSRTATAGLRPYLYMEYVV